MGWPWAGWADIRAALVGEQVRVREERTELHRTAGPDSRLGRGSVGRVVSPESRATVHLPARGYRRAALLSSPSNGSEAGLRSGSWAVIQALGSRVGDALEWPSRLEPLSRGIPARTHLAQAAWRRSWGLSGGRPAGSQEVASSSLALLTDMRPCRERRIHLLSPGPARSRAHP